MFITKCDICQEEVSYPNQINLDYRGTSSKNFAFCLACGEPLANFLKKHELLAN